MELLNILKDSEFVSGQAIAGSLGVTRSAVHKQIMSLRRQGYSVIAQKNRGYMLKSRPDCAAPEEIRRYLPRGHRWGAAIHYFPSTPSTQLIAKDLAIAGGVDGTLVLAESQSAGYGRLQRVWSSPAGGLWFSLLLRPSIRPDAVPQLTLVCSLILSQTIERICGISSLIKWPNDLVVPDGSSTLAGKLAGIITEMSAEVDRVAWVVVGIGINVNNALPDAAAPHAVSLSSLTKTPVERARLLASFLCDFEIGYRRFCREGFAPFAQDYNQRSFLRDKTIDIEMFGEIVHGRVESVDDGGFLLFQKNGGTIEKIVAGTVTRVYD
ncbi:MAG: biotin--[acetyl-CoA-carboxylase] ligase [Elusimicrobia bacterium]|nr:biotin--[acetyl-CoA-carboxylase] ligase [Elusimicrobiota bacterium]